MKKIWKDIAGYEGLYQVSNTGSVKSLKNNIILKCRKDTKGYLQVALFKNGIRKEYRVHRLVAEAFIPNSNNLPQINHIDGNKTNNNIFNLEWCNNQYNAIHAIKTGLRKTTQKQIECGKKQIKFAQEAKKKAVVQYDIDMNFIAEYNSIKDAESKTGISNKHISSVCLKRYGRKTAGGYIWRYKEI